MRRLLLFVSILLCLSSSALAQEPTEEARLAAEEHSRLGVEHYAAGRFPDAVREMLLAWQAVPDPGLLYNVARIYQAMDETDLAIDYLQRFVSDPGADPATVQKALQHLTELREAGSDETPSEAPVLELAPPIEEVQPLGNETPIPTPRSLRPQHLLIGTGLASLGTGSFFGYKAFQAQKQYNDSELELDERQAAGASGPRLARFADLGIGTGAILICGGLIIPLRDGSLSLSPGPQGTLQLSYSP